MRLSEYTKNNVNSIEWLNNKNYNVSSYGLRVHSEQGVGRRQCGVPRQVDYHRRVCHLSQAAGDRLQGDEDQT